MKWVIFTVKENRCYYLAKIDQGGFFWRTDYKQAYDHGSHLNAKSFAEQTLPKKYNYGIKAVM